eukprot:tig00000215_g18635.t1
MRPKTLDAAAAGCLEVIHPWTSNLASSTPRPSSPGAAHAPAPPPPSPALPQASLLSALSLRARPVCTIRWFDAVTEYPLPHGEDPLTVRGAGGRAEPLSPWCPPHADILAEASRQASAPLPRAKGRTNAPPASGWAGGRALRQQQVGLPPAEGPQPSSALGLSFVVRWVEGRRGGSGSGGGGGGGSRSSRHSRASSDSGSRDASPPALSGAPPAGPADPAAAAAAAAVAAAAAGESSVEECLTPLLFQLLHVRSAYLDGGRQEATVFGRSLSLAPLDRQEESFLFIELLRLGHLTGETLTHPNVPPPPYAPPPPSPPQPLPGSPAGSPFSSVYGNPVPAIPPAIALDALSPSLAPVPLAGPTATAFHLEVNLVCRVMTLLPLRCREGAPWEGAIDHDLAAFLGVSRCIQRPLRSLCDALLAAACLRRFQALPLPPDAPPEASARPPLARLSPRGYIDLAARLPFRRELSTTLGIVCKHWLQCEQAPSPADLAAAFPSAVDPFSDLIAGFAFWDQAMLMMAHLRREHAIPDDIAAQFDRANAFLGMKRSAGNAGAVVMSAAQAAALGPIALQVQIPVPVVPPAGFLPMAMPYPGFGPGTAMSPIYMMYPSIESSASGSGILSS